MPWPLVGRERELQAAGALLSDARAGGVVLTGPAGVGKTRLAAEIDRLARARGCAVEWVRATRSASAIPLGAFGPLLPATGDGAAGVALLARARAALVERAAGARVVLCVDDGHLLDHGSAVLLHQLAAAREAFAVVTVRRGEPVPDAVQALWKDELCERLDLGELSLDEVDRMLAGALGGDVDGRTVHALWELTRGNALYVRELVRHGLEHGDLTDAGGLWRWRGAIAVGTRLAELVGDRLDGLDADPRRALELVAAGAPLEVGLLHPGEQAQLAALEERGLVEHRVDGRRRSVDVAHPLHGELVRAQLPGIRLEAIQRRLADAIEVLGGRRREDVGRIAAWRLHSGGGTAELFERAARQALAALDFTLARRFAEAAMHAGGFGPQLALAQALAGMGRASEAEDLLAGLEPHVAFDGDRAAVAIARARNLFWGADRAEEADAVLRGAEQELSDRGLRDELRALRIRLEAGRGRPLEALGAARELLEADGVAERAKLHAAVAASEALLSRGRTGEALRVVEAWEPAARRHRESLPHAEPQLLGQRAMALRIAGDLVAATDAAQRMDELALSRRSGQGTAVAASALGATWLARGRVRTALRCFRESVALLRDEDALGLLPWALAGVAQAAAQAGDAAGARQAVGELDRARLRGLRAFEPELGLGRAWGAAAAGETTRARALAGEAAELARSRGQDGFELRALHDQVRLGDAARAAPRLEVLAGQVDGELAPLAAAHASALVAGDGGALADVAEGFARGGALLAAAEAASAAAAAHRDAGRQASARAAAARSAHWLAACEGARPPSLPQDGAGETLTSRELEVAGLAARGLSSREVADRLVVSVRTVDTHLRNTYRKLGIAGREELAGRIARPE